MKEQYEYLIDEYDVELVLDPARELNVLTTHILSREEKEAGEGRSR